MRMVCQRVLEAEVKVNEQRVGKIDKGLLVYLGVGKGDSENDAQFMADKLANLRIFADEAQASTPQPSQRWQSSFTRK
jgi:D-tyrosyl-tRNA(Tyr) deacylase